MNSLYELPGFLDAVQRESLIRSAAFLPVVENINGFRVKPMTLTHYALLRIMESPFMPPFQEAGPHDLIAFLWVLSEDHRQDPNAFNDFIETKCASLLPITTRIFKTTKWRRRCEERLTNIQRTMDSARAYVDESLMDMPQSSGRRGYSPEYFSDAACICALLAREYGYSRSEAMNTPIKCIFQFLNEIRQHHTPEEKLTLFNPISGRVISDYLAKVNAKN